MTLHTHIVDENKHKEFIKEERHDPFTLERIKPGDRIVFCAKCQCAFLLDSWKAMADNRSCISNRNNCDHTQTLIQFPETRREPLQFKKFQQNSTFSNHLSPEKSHHRPTLFSIRNIFISLIALVFVVILVIAIANKLPFNTPKSQEIHSESVSEGGDETNKSWREAFYKYSSTQQIIAPVGFVVKSAHYLEAKTLKDFNTSTVIEAAGYLDTNEGRFYMLPWSWERTLKGHKPNWVWIKGKGEVISWEDEAENTDDKTESWRYSFHKYSSTQKITAPVGLIVKSTHYLQAKTLKELNTSTVIEVVGYLETDEGRFYMSPWSWERTLNGHTPNWIWLKKMKVSFVC